jgi:hypothetical protein
MSRGKSAVEAKVCSKSITGECRCKGIEGILAGAFHGAFCESCAIAWRAWTGWSWLLSGFITEDAAFGTFAGEVEGAVVGSEGDAFGLGEAVGGEDDRGALEGGCPGFAGFAGEIEDVAVAEDHSGRAVGGDVHAGGLGAVGARGDGHERLHGGGLGEDGVGELRDRGRGGDDAVGGDAEGQGVEAVGRGAFGEEVNQAGDGIDGDGLDVAGAVEVAHGDGPGDGGRGVVERGEGGGVGFFDDVERAVGAAGAVVADRGAEEV